MRTIFCLLLKLAFCSCGSMLLNSDRNRMGFFEEKVTLSFLSDGTKEVVFFKMHHFGKKEFYNDVSFKNRFASKRKLSFLL